MCADWPGVGKKEPMKKMKIFVDRQQKRGDSGRVKTDSKQVLYQRRQRRKGRCVACGRKAVRVGRRVGVHCASCRWKARVRALARWRMMHGGAE